MQQTKRKSEPTEWAKNFDLGALAAGAMKQYQTESSELRPGINARGFFNGLTVINNSDADIAVEPDMNPDRRRPIPAHTGVPFTNMTPFQELNVVNLSAATAITAGQVYITVRYERDVLRSPGVL